MIHAKPINQLLVLTLTTVIDMHKPVGGKGEILPHLFRFTKKICSVAYVIVDQKGTKLWSAQNKPKA